MFFYKYIIYKYIFINFIYGHFKLKRESNFYRFQSWKKRPRIKFLSLNWHFLQFFLCQWEFESPNCRYSAQKRFNQWHRDETGIPVNFQSRNWNTGPERGSRSNLANFKDRFFKNDFSHKINNISRKKRDPGSQKSITVPGSGRNIKTGTLS